MQRKHISVEEGQKALEQLEHIPGEVVSARRFIMANYDTLNNAGKSLKAMHQHLLQCGIDVGSFSYFRDVYNREKRARRLAAVPVPVPSSKPPPAVQAATVPPATPAGKAEDGAATAPPDYGAKTRAMNSSKSGLKVNPDSTFDLAPVDPDDLAGLG